MIRHRPFGSGHPYSTDTDQRVPVDLIAGEPLLLGARSSAEVTGVQLELVIVSPDGTARSERHDLRRAVTRSRGEVIDGGHLASAQARLARAATGWQVGVEAPAAGSTIRYRFHADDGGRTRWFDTTVFSWQDAPVERIRVVGESRVLPGSVRVLTDGSTIRRVRLSLALSDAERVSGFGERYDAIDQRGSRLDSVVFEQYKSQGAERRTYLPMPFAHVVGGEGWGFHVRTSRRVWFDVGAASADRLDIESETDVPEADPTALEIAFYDGVPTAVLESFLAESGRAEELPPWVFRLWASGNEWNTQAEVVRQMRLHREHDIPVGSVVIEAWSDEATFTAFRDAVYAPHADGAPHALADFTFPPDGAWPDPKGMVDELHAHDVRVHLWQIPLIKLRPHPTGQAAADAAAAVRAGVVIREPDPAGALRPYRNRGWWFPLATMPDLTDPAAARWWTQKRRYLVDEIGIDGFKTDGGEHAWGRELVYLDGRRGDEKNATFPVAYAKAFGDLLREGGKAPVTFSRAGYTGSQAHGAFWAGDENSTWEAFRWSLFAGLNASACGVVYWGWDIAGFSGDLPTAELYLRAMAASVFVPIMQYHSEFNHHRRPSHDRTPWNVAELTGDARVVPLTRELVHLRERLVPLLADEARHTIRTSSPLMRPIYFDHPEDPASWDQPLRWFLGRDLFVAPVVEEGKDCVDVLLPPGRWVDVFSGERVEGSVTRATALGEVPAYARAEAWPRLQPLFQPE